MYKKIFYLIILVLVSASVFALEAKVMEMNNLDLVNDGNLIKVITKSKVKGTMIVKISEEEFDLQKERNEIRDDETCTIALLYQKDVNLSVTYNEKCKLKKEKFSFLENYQIGTDYNSRIEELVLKIVNLLDKKARKKEERTSLEVKLEENDEGKELMLNGMYDNNLDVIIYYPTKYNSKDITYTQDENSGVIELKGDTNCVIEYGLKEQEVIVDDKGRKVKPKNGKLYVEDGTTKPYSGILLSYSNAKGSYTGDIIDTLEVNMECEDDYEDTKPKDILVSYKPYVVFAHGLWANTEDIKAYGFLDLYRERYGDNFYVFDYYETNTDAIEQNAGLFAQYLLEIIKKGRQDGVKLKPALFAHSQGGLITLEVATDSYVGPKIGLVVTLATPYMGSSQVNLIFDACPKPTKEECPEYMEFLASMREFMTDLRKPPPAGFGEIGPVIEQLSTNSPLVNLRMKKEPIPPFVIVAGNKPIMHKLIMDTDLKPIVRSTSRYAIRYALNKIPYYEYVDTASSLLDTASSLVDLAKGRSPSQSNEQKKVTVADFMEWGFKRYNPPESMVPVFRDFIASLSNPDGTVSPDSALWKNEKGELVNPDYKRMMVSSNHLGIVKDNGALIIRELEGRSYTYATVGSPVNIYTYDSDGNFVGLKEGVVVNEIENSEFFINETERVQTVIIDNDEDYSFIIEGTGNGTFGFSINQKREDKDISVYYEDLIVTDTTKAFFNLTKDEEKYLMKMDYDGDGIIDIELEPDFEQVIDVEPEEKDYVRSGQIKTDFKEPESKMWIWVFGIIGVVVILLILFMLKRKHTS